jgi:hypothetical protein
MAQARHVLKALGFGASVALGLMAFFAAGAQAEAGAAWMVNGSNITSNVEVEAASESATTILESIGSSTVAILCKKLVVDDGLLEPGGKGSGTLLFSLCETFIAKKLSTACKPKEPIVAEALSLLVLHELAGGTKDDLVEFFPHAGKSFTNIHFSELCTLEVNEGAGVPITGHILVKDCQKALLTEQATHLIEEDATSTTELKLGMFYGVHPVTLDGSAILKLVGGGNWNALLG